MTNTCEMSWDEFNCLSEPLRSLQLYLCEYDYAKDGEEGQDEDKAHPSPFAWRPWLLVFLGACTSFVFLSTRSHLWGRGGIFMLDWNRGTLHYILHPMIPWWTALGGAQIYFQDTRMQRIRIFFAPQQNMYRVLRTIELEQNIVTDSDVGGEEGHAHSGLV